MLKISPLFSGSRGNCSLIQSNNANILLDVGFGYRAILQALHKHGLTPDDIDAIVISHEHSDHVGALRIWSKYVQTPVYAPQPIAHYLGYEANLSDVREIVGSFAVKDVSVDVYECSHDSICCFGYRFGCDGKLFACVTDTGCIDEHLVEFLAPCQAIMLESNHDVDMLLKGNYSYPLKKRILSDHGHLSNAQAAEMLCKLVGKSPKQVILAHLSEKNNTRELAFNSAVNMYASLGLTEGKDVNVYVADQYANDVTICLH